MRYLNNQKHIAAACALALSAVAACAPALAKQSERQHLRGVITATSDAGFTMKSDDGQKHRIALSSKSRISAVTPGDLSNIEKGTFIGTANVKENGENRALEMVIFPPSMKGAGLGDYGWDLSPSMVHAESDDSAADGGSMTSGSSMTNGTVTNDGGSMTSGSSMTNGSVESSTTGTHNADGSSIPSRSSMTNGTVSQSTTDSRMLTLTVDYGQGSKTIRVPADTPTVKVQKATKADIAKGEHVFVAGPRDAQPVTAQLVIVGLNGTVPPM